MYCRLRSREKDYMPQIPLNKLNSTLIIAFVLFLFSESLFSFEVDHTNDYAVIIVGGGDVDSTYPAFQQSASIMVKGLLSRGYRKENIRILSTDGNNKDFDAKRLVWNPRSEKWVDSYYSTYQDFDGDGKKDDVLPATKENADAIFYDIEQEMTSDPLRQGKLFVYVATHGFKDEAKNKSGMVLYGKNESLYLDEFSKRYIDPFTVRDIPVAMVLDHCYSGDFTSLEGRNRCIISASGKNERGWMMQNDFLFLTNHFASGMRGHYPTPGSEAASVYDKDGFLSMADLMAYTEDQLIDPNGIYTYDYLKTTTSQTFTPHIYHGDCEDGSSTIISAAGNVIDSLEPVSDAPLNSTCDEFDF